MFLLDRWTERVKDVSLELIDDRKDKEIAKRLLAIDYNAEISWLRLEYFFIFKIQTNES